MGPCKRLRRLRGVWAQWFTLRPILPTPPHTQPQRNPVTPNTIATPSHPTPAQPHRNPITPNPSATTLPPTPLQPHHPQPQRNPITPIIPNTITPNPSATTSHPTPLQPHRNPNTIATPLQPQHPQHPQHHLSDTGVMLAIAIPHTLVQELSTIRMYFNEDLTKATHRKDIKLSIQVISPIPT